MVIQFSICKTLVGVNHSQVEFQCSVALPVLTHFFSSPILWIACSYNLFMSLVCVLHWSSYPDVPCVRDQSFVEGSPWKVCSEGHQSVKLSVVAFINFKSLCFEVKSICISRIYIIF